MASISLKEALELADALVVTSSDGTRWLKVDTLRELEVARHAEQPGPEPKSFAEAKTLALQDPELQEAFPQPTPAIGPSPSAARA